MKQTFLNDYISFKYVLFFCFLLIASAIHYHVITLAIALFCVWALFGPKQAIQVLSLNCFILLLNYGIYQFPPKVGALRWLVLFVAALRILPFYSRRALPYFLSLIFFYFIIFILSLTASPYFVLSIMKLTAFSLCAMTVLAAFSNLDKFEVLAMRKWFFSLIVTTILFSLPTLFIHKIGYMRNGEGFQGILQHPQTFGVFLVPLAAYLWADLTVVKKRKNIWITLFGCLLLFLMFMTKARTSIAAIGLAGIVVVSIVGFFSKSVHFDWAPGKSFATVFITSALLGLLFVMTPKIVDTVEGFVFKNSDAKKVTDAFAKSRGKGAVFFWKRFLEKPLTGHGFGIDIVHGNNKKTETFMGIPTAAASEKGFLPAAFVEEVGIFGLLGILPFLFLLVRGAIKTGSVALMTMFFGCLFVNVGEAIFFSPGYIGGFFWLLLGLGTAKGWQQETEV